jgi:hypothetical protein
MESKMPNDLIRADACTIVDLLKRGEITPHDLLDTLEERIAVVDPMVKSTHYQRAVLTGRGLKPRI